MKPWVLCRLDFNRTAVIDLRKVIMVMETVPGHEHCVLYLAGGKFVDVCEPPYAQLAAMVQELSE